MSRKLSSGELFAGYGGLALAVEAAFSAETKFVAEFEEAPSKILAKRFPGVPNIGDVTSVDWSSVEKVDIIAGGSPCQDVSLAGRDRVGMVEGARSNLWVSVREAIAEIKPTFVIWENVTGARSARAISSLEPSARCVGEDHESESLRALGRVLGDLAEIGYDAQWRTVRASDVGAPHQRERVFVLAWRRGADTGSVGRFKGGKEPVHSAQFGYNLGGLGEGCVDGPTSHPYGNTAFGSHSGRIRHWETVTGRSAPAPVEPSRTGRPQLSPLFSEWLMGLPAGWVTDPAIGITRKEQLKALGNGVVPQQAYAAICDMLSGIC